ncbi:heme ABC exporter ATP-binding protein CcmA [Caulobacter segnis]|uniref:heme ABC exporter ATP-binding protein CcmA n=1 Tax=Caulobacter segnis TaxID=88688 RepID=UPI0024103FD8|nr:heme ABC exporter ATP-binding protein CcmA [Caulobacter segnis]MDG2520065.1 heme ABC exporter ATP-binding protein CcmA [Caulobacter segnis]
MITALKIGGLALSRGERALFSGLDLSVSAGEAVSLVGRNGAGKTSLLRAIAGLLRPTAGTIGFEGPDGALDPQDARVGGLHMVGHHDGLKPGRTAREELQFQADWTGGGDIDEAVRALDLNRLLDLEVRRLSAGQRRRVALARLLAAPRTLWLLDEPMAPLDAGHRRGLGEAMTRHIAGGGMIVAAVHDPLPIPARDVQVGA